MDITTKRSGVYMIKCLSNNKIYIGSSINLKQRINRHFNDLKKQKHASPQLQNAFNKYGYDSFDVIIIEDYEKDSITLKELLIIEQKYLDLYKPYIKENGFNTCPIAGSPKEFKRSEETTKKVSDKLKGHVVSEETRKKIGDGNRGKIMSRESVEKMRITKIGVKQSEESIEKRAREYSFIDINGIIYKGKNLKRFCDEHKLHRQNMVMVLNGKRKTHHGFKLFKN